MTRPEQEFHDFVVGFTDPLARLAYLLTDGTAIDASAITIDALAKVRRHWRDAETTGAPEPLAVEALITALPRQHRRTSEVQMSADESTVDTVDATTHEALFEAAWTAWRGLDSRHRMPLLFGDVSVASRRLAGLDVPDVLGRRHHNVAAEAIGEIRAGLHADRRTGDAVDAMSDEQLAAQVAEALRAHAGTASVPADPYPLVTNRVRSLRRRTVVSVAGVVALLAIATLTATRLSAAKKPPALATDHPPAAGLAKAAAAASSEVAANWPTRGNAATDAALVNGVKALFVRAHPEATGDVRVLLATDTSTFRIAYVTANSPGGVIRSWFSGPIGADELFEGASSYGGALLADSVLAAVLANTSEQAELVIIAPPDAVDMQMANFDDTPPGLFVPLASADGIAVHDVSTTETSKLTLNVHLKDGQQVVYLVPRAQLRSHSVKRGAADPGLLAAAYVAADAWVGAGTISQSSVPVALWGGTDPSGTGLVVVRLKTGDSIDGLVVESSDGNATGSARPAPTLNRPANRHYAIGAGQPDFPVAFRYGAAQVGVVVPVGIATAALVVNGNEAPPVAVDGVGFASMRLPSLAEPASDLTFRVNLYDATGGIIRTLPVPLPA